MTPHVVEQLARHLAAATRGIAAPQQSERDAARTVTGQMLEALGADTATADRLAEQVCTASAEFADACVVMHQRSAALLIALQDLADKGEELIVESSRETES